MWYCYYNNITTMSLLASDYYNLTTKPTELMMSPSYREVGLNLSMFPIICFIIIYFHTVYNMFPEQSVICIIRGESSTGRLEIVQN